MGRTPPSLSLDLSLFKNEALTIVKKRDEGRRVTAANALGKYTTCIHTHYEIELEDVGKVRDHYLGYKHKSLQLTRRDVGRTINVMTDGSGWTCWDFID